MKATCHNCGETLKVETRDMLEGRNWVKIKRRWYCPACSRSAKLAYEMIKQECFCKQPIHRSTTDGR